MRILSIISLLILAGIETHCQEQLVNHIPEVSVNDLVELFTAAVDDAGEADQTALLDWIESLLEAPINLNSASEDDLTESGLFTPFQAYGILKHREKYGPFFSIYELATIPGFRKEWLMMVAPMITTEPELASAVTSDVIKIFSLSNVSVRLPSSEAYQEEDRIYAGSPLKVIHRLKLEAGSAWDAGLIFEKDPGEQFIYSGRPEHLAGYVRYESSGLLKEMILGNYRLHTGMGLVHGLGFQSRSAGPVMNGYRTAYAKPFSSATEYNYFRGYCMTLRQGSWNLMLHGSHRPEDISFFQYGKKGELHEHIRKTGLHRTVGEREGIALANQLSTGLSLNRYGKRWNAGMLAAASRLDLSKPGRDSIGVSEPVHSSRFNLGIYGVAFGPRYQFSGEWAINNIGRSAVLAVASLELNSALQFSISFRRYGKGYTGQYPRCFGGGEDPGNSEGLNLGISLAPFPKVRCRLSMDIERPVENVPGELLSGGAVTGYEIYQLASITLIGEENNRLVFQLAKQQKPGSIPTDPAEVSVSHLQEKTQVYGQYRVGLSDACELSGRLAGSFPAGGAGPIHRLLSGSFREGLAETFSGGPSGSIFSGSGRKISSLFYQQITGTPIQLLSFTYRYTLFQIDSWDHRIYTYEPGVRYSFSFPAFHGSGSRNVVVTTCRINRWCTIRAKAGFTRYAHTLSTGSGNDTRPGSRIFDAELQIQMKL